MDWAWLYYQATVELGMSDKEFWNCTHKKLQALLRVHREILEMKYCSSDKNNKEEYIDNISL